MPERTLDLWSSDDKIGTTSELLGEQHHSKSDAECQRMVAEILTLPACTIYEVDESQHNIRYTTPV